MYSKEIKAITINKSSVRSTVLFISIPPFRMRITEYCNVSRGNFLKRVDWIPVSLYTSLMMEKFKNFILPAFILFQLLIVIIKKLIDKKKKETRNKNLKEYSRRLGLSLKETEDGKQLYLSLRIHNHNAFLIYLPISGGAKESLALLIAIDHTRIDKTFSFQKKFRLPYKKLLTKTTGVNQFNIEETYDIRGSDENFKKELLNRRVIAHILSVQPENLFFLNGEDAKTMFIPWEAETDSFLLLTINIPDEYRKINELIELGRVITRTLDSI
jgi:hypothetical protein